MNMQMLFNLSTDQLVQQLETRYQVFEKSLFEEQFGVDPESSPEMAIHTIVFVNALAATNMLRAAKLVAGMTNANDATLEVLKGRIHKVVAEFIDEMRLDTTNSGGSEN